MANWGDGRETSPLPLHSPFGPLPPVQGPDGPVFPWLPGFTYGVGNLVTHGGVVYRSVSGNTGVTPGTDPLVWETLGTGGGGGAVASVNGHVGVVVLGHTDVGAASAAQGAKADTAVQPGALAPVALSGQYGDLSGTPILAAVALSGDYADLLNPPTIPTTPGQVGADPAGSAAAAQSAAQSYTDLVALTKADLVGGVVPTAQIPAIAITEFLGSVSTQGAMLALTGELGDWCIRTDLGTTFVITGPDPTQITDWTALPVPSVPVVSVNGQTGAITLGYADVGAASAAQGALASTAVQPGDLAAVATSGLYSDLWGTPTIPSTPGEVGADAAGAAAAAQAYSIQRANHTGTQPLSSLAQSGASASDVATWDGSAWVPAAPSGGGVSAGITHTGSAAPDAGLGADGDWYERSGTPMLLYRKESGAWVSMGPASTLFARTPILRAAPWTPNSQGANFVENSPIGDLLNTSTTGVTKVVNTYTCVAANARGRWPGVSKATLSATIQTMPGAGQVLQLGCGYDLNGMVALHAGLVEITDAGAVIIRVVSGIVATLPGVTAQADDQINCRLMPGALFVNLKRGNDTLSREFAVNSNLSAATADAYPFSVAMGGHGAWSSVSLEVYA